VACFNPADASVKGAGASIYKNGELKLGLPSPSTLYDNPQWEIWLSAGNALLRLGKQDKKGFPISDLDKIAIYSRILAV
jgi:hypothetical protein